MNRIKKTKAELLTNAFIISTISLIFHEEMRRREE